MPEAASGSGSSSSRGWEAQIHGVLPSGESLIAVVSGNADLKAAAEAHAVLPATKCHLFDENGRTIQSGKICEVEQS